MTRRTIQACSDASWRTPKLSSFGYWVQDGDYAFVRSGLFKRKIVNSCLAELEAVLYCFEYMAFEGSIKDVDIQFWTDCVPVLQWIRNGRAKCRQTTKVIKSVRKMLKRLRKKNCEVQLKWVSGNKTGNKKSIERIIHANVDARTRKITRFLASVI